MTFLIVRVRSDRGVERSIRDTMAMMNLTRVNHATIVPESSTYAGMLQKSKDFVTWGVVDAGTIENLLKERGRMVGDKPVDDAAIKAGSEFKSVKDFAKALASGEATMKSVDGLKTGSYDFTLLEAQRGLGRNQEGLLCWWRSRIPRR